MKHLIKSIFALALVSLSGLTNAQPWKDQAAVSNPEPDFYSIREAGENYWSTHTIDEKGNGHKPYRRWEYFWSQRLGDPGQIGPGVDYWGEFKRAQEARSAKSASSSDIRRWKLLGPKNTIPLGGGVGRINSITFHPTNPNIMMIGTPAGGIWKTVDDGVTWESNTDNLPTLGVSDIAFDPSNPETIYIGTGDRNAADSYAVGVLKSTDGGASYVATGLAWTVNQQRTVNRLLVHPVNTNIIIAGTSAGIWRSVDAGANWVLEFSGDTKDLEFMPGFADTLYAAVGGAVYRSKDAGDTWSKLTAFPGTGINRIELAVTPANSEVVYALASNSATNGFRGLYRSTTHGNTWTTQSTSPNIFDWNITPSGTGGQGWYDIALGVSPTNENLVFAGGVNIWKSTNGGGTWTNSTYWQTGGGKPYVHADIHVLTFKPGSATTVYAGTDGGFFLTATAGTSWYDRSAGLQIQQIYRLSSSQMDSSFVITGAQDNGSNLWSELATSNQMDQVLGGDGMDNIYDPTDNAYIYASSQYGNIRRSSNTGGSFANIKPAGTANGAWITPYIIDPSQPNVLYSGYADIYKSTDRGTNWTKKTTSINAGSNLSFMHMSKASSNIVYAASTSKIWRSSNAGDTWTNITAGLTLSGSQITRIWVHETNADSVYVTLSNYGSTNKVFLSPNGGASWQNITKTGLPSVPVNCIVHQGMTENHDIYVGTDYGVYHTDNSMSTWEPFSDGLPNTIVQDLDIQYSSSKLRAATYGRGLWEVDTKVYTSESGKGDVTSIKKVKAEMPGSVTVFPNPAESVVTLMTNGSEKTDNANILIQDIQGKTLIDLQGQKLVNHQISVDVSSLPPGMYTITLRTDRFANTQKLSIK